MATSATKTFPEESVTIPSGYLKVAIVPIPFIKPKEPVPDKVETKPELVIFRIQLLL